MTRLLIETHVPDALAQQLRQRGIDALGLQDWRGGSYRTADDDAILTAATADQHIVVTFDRKTFTPLLKAWAEEGRHHAGAVLIPRRTFAPTDIGGMLGALVHLLEEFGDQSWEDRLVYLTPVNR
jgi:DNA-binding transcriptional LysR family regulator